MSRCIASLSLDLDNKWAYLRAAGRKDWDERGGYLPLVIDRIVDLLGSLDLPLTVFTVGRDLVDDEDCEAICSFNRLKSWEPANHSLSHLPWMHTMQPEEIADEIEITHDRIQHVTQRRPLGFRGPGFSCPPEVLRVLARNRYLYDASIFPTSVAPIARAVFLFRTNLKGQQRERAKKLYGGFASLCQPNRPFQRKVDDTQLWEIPVTVMPFVRTPIHFSYFTYLASFSVRAAKAYFNTALWLCRSCGSPPSLLLHPLDFLGCEDDTDMAYFPAMQMKRSDKLAIVRWGLNRFAEVFDVRRMVDHLRMIDPAVDPDLAYPEGAVMVDEATLAATANATT